MIIENNLLSQDKCAKLFSSTQILKKHIKIVGYVKYEQKTSPYPPLFPNKNPTLVSQVTDSSILFVIGDEGREAAELYTKQNTWEKDRRFVVSRVLKPEKERE